MSALSSKVAQTVTSSDGIHIYADAVGNPEMPCIVMVHGYQLSGDVFNHIFSNPQYSKEFYLVRYDMRGHGRSGKPETAEGHASQLYADDYAAVAKAFKVKKNAILVGWSLGAVIPVDIATYLPKDTIGGIVYLAGLPYIGSIIARVAKPGLLNLLPDLSSTDDVEKSLKARLTFANMLFVRPEEISYELKSSWLGMGVVIPPKVAPLLVQRSQDPARLFELAADGLPLLIVHGTEDAQIIGDVVVKEMRPCFKDIEVKMIEDSGHAVFYEKPEETMKSILSFARRLTNQANLI